MKKLACVLCAAALSGTASAQQLPPSTEEARHTAVDLVLAFQKAGAIRRETDPATGRPRFVVADETRLRDEARRRRDELTPAVRNALIAAALQPGTVSVLEHLAREKGDEEGVAFAAFLTGKVARAQLKYREARRGYEQAAGQFGRLKKPD